ncbi:MAG: hypothetical protein ATN35_10595 [Epulopiscium sp. Nele67-Bin004]|nr:MAG: hypothetical protein ATN35_10595 [Epulopiscium sp. Nele67-Bin004]
MDITNDTRQFAEEYYQTALTLFEQSKIEEAINYIDLAVTVGENKMTYLIKKIELLHVFECNDEYIRTFTAHIKLFYDQLNLKEFCIFFNYYVQIFHMEDEYFFAILKEAELPTMLYHLHKQIAMGGEVLYAEEALRAFDDKKYVQASEYAQLAQKDSNISLDTLLIGARSFKFIEEANRAITQYKYIINDFPEDKYSYFELGTIYYLSNNYGEALSLLKTAIKYGYDQRDCVEPMADCYYYLENYSTAVVYLKKSIKTSTNLHSTYSMLAKSYEKLNKPLQVKKYNKLAKKYQTAFPPPLMNATFISLLMLLYAVIGLII